MSCISRTLVAALLLQASTALAHGHGPHKHEEKKTEAPRSPDRLAQVGASYREKVEPLFKRSCFNCHSGTTEFPWYYKIPGAKQLIDHDINEAKTHLDFSDGFPFHGHGTPLEDLQAIEKVLRKDTMPPWRYLIFHKSHKLSDADRKIILDWAVSSQKYLTQP